MKMNRLGQAIGIVMMITGVILMLVSIAQVVGMMK